MRQAIKAEQEIMAGKYRGPLHGIVVAVKDNMWTAGIRTMAGSRILADFVPQSNATVVDKLYRAGAVLIGKTNMSEFASGATNENAFFGPTRNPWNPKRITGGSSGGSAAAVAACLSYGALGTDTGGSIRIPAALCGVVGLKPTTGRVSRYGLVPLSTSLDQVGPLARGVRDAAFLLTVIAGYDARDSQSIPREVPNFAVKLRSRVKRRGLGWPRELFAERLERDVKAAMEAAAVTFCRLGTPVKEISLPHAGRILDSAMKIEYAEAARYHRAAGFLPARAGEYGERVRIRLEEGAKVLAVDYLEAQDLRDAVRADFQAAFRDVDAILVPTAPVPAPSLGQATVRMDSHREPVRAALIGMNPAANFAGLPAISLPCGFTTEGLPIGLQLIGPAFAETTLLNLAYAYEQETEWHRLRPNLDGL